ncbi:hypothetical protein GLAREA_06148 [Glarea lozoyensis ATCC 20868]|uniref:Uncharacterized protein n=1 Tax=Glarea lozoyensis (strain ATCC 20868 / MF5171) TaxID=1116229 RepID=S3DM38_GLAL2|nr:uncharacterized protein GLAREA_06148 [Glarea lozoyensis ATCC 20868]EPE33136.1 hypothetical protein GLAREA_06148 [Glarea lozoyensis ATCC 20868]
MCYRRIHLYGGKECRCVWYEDGPWGCGQEPNCGHDKWSALYDNGGCIIQEEVMLQECPYHSPSREQPTNLPAYDDPEDYDDFPTATSSKSKPSQSQSKSKKSTKHSSSSRKHRKSSGSSSNGTK